MRLIGSSKRLEEFNRWYASTMLAKLSYLDALGIYTNLWRYARQMSDAFPASWKEDIAVDIELARVLNGVVRQR